MNPTINQAGRGTRGGGKKTHPGGPDEKRKKSLKNITPQDVKEWMHAGRVFVWQDKYTGNHSQDIW